MLNYVILGTGVAGIAAAEAIRALDNASSITFITDDSHEYYSRPGMAYYLTGEVDEKQLYPYQPQDYKKLNAHFLRGTATRIMPDQHLVELNDGTRIPYDRLLIAIGAGAVRLNVPGASLDGVVKLDHMEDVQRIVGLSRRARSAVVIGGGITALELAEGLAARNVKVHLLIRTERTWSNVLDEVESKIIHEHLLETGIIIHYSTELGEVLGERGRVKGIRTVDGLEIACEILAYGIGVKPRLRLAAQAGIACARGVLVDEHLCTNFPDIYAAGDVAQVFDPALGRTVLDSLWSPAREQGNVAGMNMAGKNMAYLKAVPLNVTRLAGLTTTIIGLVGSGQPCDMLDIARGDSETWHEMPDAILAQNGFQTNHLRLMVADKNIVGALVMGDQKLSGALQAIIRDRIDIASIREQLLLPGAPLADIIAQFFGQVYASRN